MRHLRDNSLSLFFLTIFVAALLAQSIAGQQAYNEEQQAHDEPTVSYVRYVSSSHFGQAVMENWQSEWLQFVLFTLATVWFVQRGSGESKKPEDAGLESDRKQLVGGYATRDSPRWATTRDWERTLQNWQSEFLAVGTMAVFTIYLRQRGSPESKPVGAPHEATGSSE
jgi:hypothetical protein